MKKKYKVYIVNRLLTHYRRPFYELLKKRLDVVGVELGLIYGAPSKREARKNDNVEITWAHHITNKCIEIGPYTLYWQPCLRELRGADLVIVEQASKLLLNYVLLIMQLLGNVRLCFWGHGKNFQEHNASTIGEGIKEFVSRHVHWWFAYNDLSSDVIKSLGYPESRITSVQNAIDTCRLVEARQQTTQDKLARIKKEMEIRGENVCLFTGGMYPEKRLDFLLGACERIRDAVKDFEMIFIGAGIDDNKVKKAAAVHTWIHYVGPKFNGDKVPYFMLSKLVLMPGLVGLAVLDSFAMETPLVTTNISYHSPEIDYLVNGINGVSVQDAENPKAYADIVCRLLKNHDEREKLVEGCRVARDKYTLEKMVERFASGVMKALSL